MFRGVSAYTIGQIITYIAGFLVNFLLAQRLDIEQYGMYAYGSTALIVLLLFSKLGSDKAILRFLSSSFDDSVRSSYLSIAITTSLFASVFIAIIVFLSAPLISRLTINNPIFISVLRVFSVILILDTMMEIGASTFRSLELAGYDIGIRKFLRRVMELTAVIIGLSIGVSLVEIIWLIALASLLTTTIAMYLLWDRLSIRPTFHLPQEIDLRSYYNYSLPLAAKDAGSYLYTRADIVMVGIFLSASSVGVYNIAVLLVGVIALPLGAVNQLLPPIVSRLYSDGDIEMVSGIYQTAIRWSLTASLPLAIGAVIFRRELLAIFGEEFVIGGLILATLSVSKFIDASSAVTGYILMMSNHQYLNMINQWTFAIVNIILNFVLILELGALGAAIATTVTLFGINTARIVELWYYEGIQPYTRRLFKPVLAGIPAAVIMYLSKFLIQGFEIAIIGGLIGIIVYMFTIYQLGLEEEDIRLIREIR